MTSKVNYAVPLVSVDLLSKSNLKERDVKNYEKYEGNVSHFGFSIKSDTDSCMSYNHYLVANAIKHLIIIVNDKATTMFQGFGCLDNPPMVFILSKGKEVQCWDRTIRYRHVSHTVLRFPKCFTPLYLWRVIINWAS